MSHPVSATVLAVSLCLWAGFSCAEMMQVTGVPDGDHLNVRKGPSASSADIGDLHEGDVVDVRGENVAGTWSHIRYRGETAWVASRYLTRTVEAGRVATVSGFPLGITCRGTEPFWTLTIAQDRMAEFTSLVDGPAPITALTQATPSTGGGYPFAFTAPPYVGTLDAQACSDGMSDISYAMSLVLTNPSQGWTGPLYGCCNVD
ncbi:SH3 domain-containing protein [Celeribacter sp.]|uniref:SH3 domain-containing protein n=1 Tax=Celeribacter sp. TaxID=1890673 RepID=UPI003A95484B